jgi:hypothetical protein
MSSRSRRQVGPALYRYRPCFGPTTCPHVRPPRTLAGRLGRTEESGEPRSTMRHRPVSTPQSPSDGFVHVATRSVPPFTRQGGDCTAILRTVANPDAHGSMDLPNQLLTNRRRWGRVAGTSIDRPSVNGWLLTEIAAASSGHAACPVSGRQYCRSCLPFYAHPKSVARHSGSHRIPGP